jgi:hypothetical protein
VRQLGRHGQKKQCIRGGGFVIICNHVDAAPNESRD